MKKSTILTIGLLSLAIGLAAACSSASNTPTTNKANTSNQTAANNAPANAANKDEDAPANVKAVFSDAQSFTKQHKDIPAGAITDIEKDTGGKVPDTDHHSYLAFATKDGKRTQVGAATVVKADGKDIVIVYENKDGMPTIKVVHAEGVSEDFLKQFAGKGHDDKFAVGGDVKANGVDEATAKAIAQAVRIDSLTMQTLYGAAHSH